MSLIRLFFTCCALMIVFAPKSIVSDAANFDCGEIYYFDEEERMCSSQPWNFWEHCPGKDNCINVNGVMTCTGAGFWRQPGADYHTGMVDSEVIEATDPYSEFSYKVLQDEDEWDVYKCNKPGDCFCEFREGHPRDYWTCIADPIPYEDGAPVPSLSSEPCDEVYGG